MSLFNGLALSLSRPFQIFSLLQYRNYRLYWIGLVSQVTGQHMTVMTIGWLAYHLTGSALALGLINVLQAAPRIALTFLGGVMADRIDPRRLIFISQVISASLMAGLGVLVYTDLIAIWHIAAGAFLIGLVHSFDEPSRRSLYPHLLPDRSYIPKAVPLNSIAWQANRVVAPSIAGFVIAAAGADASFLLAAIGAVIMACSIRMLNVGAIEQRSRGSVLQNLTEGANYAWSQRIFRTVVSMAFMAALFAMGYHFMMPVFAEDVFRVGPRGLGLLLASAGAGSVIAVFTVSRLIHALTPGRVIQVASMTYASLIIAFALTPNFNLALAVLMMIGYCQVVFLISGEIVLQTLVPDRLRGRVMALYGMAWSIAPLGGALLNAAASLVGPRMALGGAGFILLLFVAIVGLRSLDLRNVQLWVSDAEPRQRAEL